MAQPTLPRNRFLLTTLNNLEGVALVRYDAARKIHGCAAAAIRMRVKGQNCDQITCLYPAQLWEAMATATPPIAETRLITADRFKRATVRFEDEPDYTAFYETATPGGAWGMMTFRRVGAKANFEQLERQLDNNTWNLPQGASAIGNGSTLRLADGAVEFAEAVFSAWELMVTAATLIGGVEPLSVPVCAVGGDPVIEKVAEDELAIRQDLDQRRRAERLGAGHHREMVSAISRISDPAVLRDLEEVMKKMKTQVAI